MTNGSLHRCRLLILAIDDSRCKFYSRLIYRDEYHISPVIIDVLGRDAQDVKDVTIARAPALVSAKARSCARYEVPQL